MTISNYFFSFLFLLLATTGLQAQTPTAGEQSSAAIPLSAEAVSPLKEGSHIPPISLTTPEGASFNLNAFVKQQPAVLVFYRGGWCPYCNMHLKELMEADPKLRALGFEILAVSPDKPEKLAESMEKHEMTYRLLSDTAMGAAQALGVAFKVEDTTIDKFKQYGIDLEASSGEKHHLLPVPSVFIIDREGIIRYSYHNPDYKIRMNTEELIEKASEAL